MRVGYGATREKWYDFEASGMCMMDEIRAKGLTHLIATSELKMKGTLTTQ